MDRLRVAEINISQINDDSLRQLRGKPALVKINRRVRAVLIPVDDKEDGLWTLQNCLGAPNDDDDTSQA